MNLSALKYVTGASKIVLFALSVFHETAVRLGYTAGIERYVFASAIDLIHDYTDPGVDLKKNMPGFTFTGSCGACCFVNRLPVR
jgi:hypothetical protein